MNCLYTIPLCNFGFAFRHATCVIVKDFGKALLKNKSSPIFFHTNYPNGNRYLKLPTVREDEITQCIVSNNGFLPVWFGMFTVLESFVVSFS